MVEQLKIQIAKTPGRQVSSRGDCELLSEDLFRRTGMFISYNTFRRMFGLAEFRQPRQSTLDYLSVYVGFKSFQDFSSRFVEVDTWPTWERLYVNLACHDIQETIELLRYRQLNNMNFAVSFAIVARELILRGDTNSLLKLFRHQDFQFAQMPYDEVAQIGVLTGLIFRTYSNDSLEKRLLEEPNFRDLVLKIYVDYGTINGRYGKWIDWVSSVQDLDEETKTFVECIGVWKDFIKLGSASKDAIQSLPKLDNNQHPILFGRLFGLQIMWETNANIRSQLKRKIQKQIQAAPEKTLEFLHEPAIQALVTRNPHLVEVLWTQSSTINQIHYWYNLSQFSIHQVFQVSDLIARSEFAEAQSVLENIAINHVRHGYRELIDLFISFFRAEISNALGKKEPDLAMDFEQKKIKLNYPLFTDEYFQRYFTKQRVKD